MKINKFIRNASVILIILCLILSLSSCNRAVTFNKDFSECTYNGNSYISIKTTPERLCWYPLPSIDSVEKVDNYPLWPIWNASGDPIYATSEKSPNFLIINLAGEDSKEFNRTFLIVLMRKDLELTSVYDTSYQKIIAEYSEGVRDEEKYFSNYPSGMTFKDLIGDGEGISDFDLDGLEYYCTLHCTYPSIDYLMCDLLIWKEIITGRFYFQTYDESNQRILYPIKLDQVLYSQSA